MSATIEILAQIKDTRTTLSMFAQSRVASEDEYGINLSRRSLELRLESLESQLSEAAYQEEVAILDYRLFSKRNSDVRMGAMGKALADFQVFFSTAFDGYKHGPKLRSHSDAFVDDRSAFQFADAYIGSAGLLFTIKNQSELFNSDLEAIMTDVFRVTQFAQSSEINVFAKKFGVAAVRKLYIWANDHVLSDIDAEMKWQSGRTDQAVMKVSTERFRQLKDTIAEASEEELETVETFGLLVGVDTTYKTFHLLLPSNTAIKGTISSDLPSDKYGNYILDSVRVPLFHAGGMAFAQKNHTKGAINRAGKELARLRSGESPTDEILSVINNWRSCHSYPLQVIKMTLLQRAKKLSPTVTVAQRLKRLPSIYIKLRDNPQMELSQMQDLGGCRAILQTVEEVDALISHYEKSNEKNPQFRPTQVHKSDYIASPKADGYRGIHLIYKYDSPATSKMYFRGQRIEIQIRTALQHAWATAVEVSQTFTGLALKSKYKTASHSWQRFFALMGSAIASRENRPLVPNTPSDIQALTNELRSIAEQERIIQYFQSWNVAMAHLMNPTINADTYLLILDPIKKQLSVTPFTKDQMQIAQEQYSDAEKRVGNDPSQQVVLVSVNSVDALRSAYPNYYVDTEAFIRAVRLAIL